MIRHILDDILFIIEYNKVATIVFATQLTETRFFIIPEMYRTLLKLFISPKSFAKFTTPKPLMS